MRDPDPGGGDRPMWGRQAHVGAAGHVVKQNHHQHPSHQYKRCTPAPSSGVPLHPPAVYPYTLKVSSTPSSTITTYQQQQKQQLT